MKTKNPRILQAVDKGSNLSYSSTDYSSSPKCNAEMLSILMLLSVPKFSNMTIWNRAGVLWNEMLSTGGAAAHEQLQRPSIHSLSNPDSKRKLEEIIPESDSEEINTSQEVRDLVLVNKHAC